MMRVGKSPTDVAAVSIFSLFIFCYSFNNFIFVGLLHCTLL